MSDGPIQIRESTFGDPSGNMRVDEEAHVIHDVKCLGRESQNGRVYTDQAMEDAKGFYEGIDVNLDHPGEDDAHAPRRMAEGFGVLRNTRVLETGVYADLHYLAKHPMADVIVERAQRFPSNFGLSHNAVGKVREEEDGKLIVEGLERVESVDIVGRPATTAGLFESKQRSHSMFAKGKPKHTVRSILEAHPKDNGAVALLVLLEEQGFVDDAALPVETEEPNAKDAIKAALRKLVLQAFDDDKLDAGATVARIKKIIQTQEKLTKQLADDEGAAGVPATPEEAMEAVVQKLNAIERREGMRDLLESLGLQRSDLTADQRKIVDRQDLLETVEELLETWQVKPAPNQHSPRPAIGSARDHDPGGQSYADLKEQTRPKPRKQAVA